MLLGALAAAGWGEQPEAESSFGPVRFYLRATYGEVGLHGQAALLHAALLHAALIHGLLALVLDGTLMKINLNLQK